MRSCWNIFLVLFVAVVLLITGRMIYITNWTETGMGSFSFYCPKCYHEYKFIRIDAIKRCNQCGWRMYLYKRDLPKNVRDSLDSK